jgi:hypothetical protein
MISATDAAQGLQGKSLPIALDFLHTIPAAILQVDCITPPSEKHRIRSPQAALARIFPRKEMPGSLRNHVSASKPCA